MNNSIYLRLKKYKGYTGRNPKTGEKVKTKIILTGA